MCSVPITPGPVFQAYFSETDIFRPFSIGFDTSGPHGPADPRCRPVKVTQRTDAQVVVDTLHGRNISVLALAFGTAWLASRRSMTWR